MKKFKAKELLKNSGTVVLNSIRQVTYEKIDDEVYNERYNGIINATLAMKEAGIENEIIVSLLQKYWDLRLSEAEEFVCLYN